MKQNEIDRRPARGDGLESHIARCNRNDAQDHTSTSGPASSFYRDHPGTADLVRASLPRTARTSDPAFRSQVRRLHRLGARPLAEFILEIVERIEAKAWLVDRLWQYANINPQLVEDLNAADFPTRAEVVAIDGRRA